MQLTAAEAFDVHILKDDDVLQNAKDGIAMMNNLTDAKLDVFFSSIIVVCNRITQPASIKKCLDGIVIYDLRCIIQLIHLFLDDFHSLKECMHCNNASMIALLKC